MRKLKIYYFIMILSAASSVFGCDCGCEDGEVEEEVSVLHVKSEDGL